jgi:hypothetical protein
LSACGVTKELRLAGVATLAAANAYLPGFMARYNARFAQAPQDPQSAWVPVPEDLDSHYYFAIRETRTVGADHCIRYAGQFLQLLPGPRDPSLVHQRVSVHIVPEGELYLYHGRRRLAYRPVAEPAPEPRPAPSAALAASEPMVRQSSARQRAWLFGQG